MRVKDVDAEMVMMTTNGLSFQPCTMTEIERESIANRHTHRGSLRKSEHVSGSF